ncbi:MAG TPA: Ger(x)C family spore germination protein [Bacillota bacterium]
MNSSVYGAFTTLRTKTNRHLVVQQNKLIVIGEQAARKGVKSLLDWLNRTPKAPPQALIFISNRPAVDVLGFQPSDSNMPGLDFIATKTVLKKESHTFLIPVWRFREILIDGAEDLYAPMLGLDLREGQYLQNGLAIFNGDRLVGELSRAETQSFGILTNQIKGGSISYRDGSGMWKGKFSMRNVSAKTRIKVKLNHGRPYFLIETKITGFLAELLGRDHELTPGSVNQLERVIETETRQNLIKLIGKMQRLQSDGIGFGEKLRAQHYGFWKGHNWKQLYPTSRFQVVVKADVIRNGVTR